MTAILISLKRVETNPLFRTPGSRQNQRYLPLFEAYMIYLRSSDLDSNIAENIGQLSYMTQGAAFSWSGKITLFLGDIAPLRSSISY